MFKFFSDDTPKPITHVGKFSRDEIAQLIDQMFAQNEGNNFDRYKLSKLPIGKSGYTFGRCQHDCAQRLDARNFIKSCLENANISTEIVDSIMSKLSDHKLTLDPNELNLVNETLSLPENINIINQFDKIQIEAIIDHVAAVAAGLNGEVGDKVKDQILNNPKVFLQLADYHNQFNLSPKGPLRNFLNGESIDRSEIEDGLTITINSSKLIDKALIDQIREFINEYTIYGNEHRKDCHRRQKNIDRIDLIAHRPPSSGPKHPSSKPGGTPKVPPSSAHPPSFPNPTPNHPTPKNPTPNYPGPIPRPKPSVPKNPMPTPKPAVPSPKPIPKPAVPKNPTPTPKPTPKPGPIIIVPPPIMPSSLIFFDNQSSEADDRQNNFREGMNLSKL